MAHLQLFSRFRRYLWALGIGGLGMIAAASNMVGPQAVAAAASDEAPQPAAINGAGLEEFASDQLFRILGKDVVSATGEKMGRIVDVLFDHSGKPFAAVIDFGGFLGVGMRKIAVDWNALRFDLGEKNHVIILDLGREQLQAAPEYKESGKSVAVVTLPQFGPSEAATYAQ
jgi:hypothetical protein